MATVKKIVQIKGTKMIRRSQEPKFDVTVPRGGRIVGFEACPSVYDNGERKTVDWYWTAWIAFD